MGGQEMTETQRKWLTEKFLGECWHDYQTGIPPEIFLEQCTKCGQIKTDFDLNRTFTTAQDKQDLLEKIDKKHEWKGFISHCVENEEFSYKWLILLSPLETAELICKWKWCV
jgi:uncharacterized protein YprB with RNaseH-like and TPR domain